MTPELGSALAKLPDKPGVYLMKDARGDVIYVGKAQSLRNRVRSYWQKQALGGEIHRIRSVIDRVADVEVTQTDSVSEALLLEANLIKRYRPRFNVRLKDDKSYPYIKITLGDDFPRIERTRKLVNDGSRYFGPYASASSVDESMNLVRRLFPFRTCTIDIKDGVRALQRPCLLYHIKRCQGPCITAIGADAYRADIAQVELFLEGRQETLVKALDGEMTAAAERTEYERAAALRDKIRAIERTMESQKMAAFARTELDLLGLARQDNQAAIQLFVIRDGKMIGRDVFLLDAAREATDDEVLSSFLEQYYSRAGSDAARGLPADDDRRGRPSSRRSWPIDAAGPSTCAIPQRGEKRELMVLATRNAGETLAREQARWLADHGKTLAALEELAEALGLPGPPSRIECYDISNFQGSESVGSMVVFEDGKPRSGEYRRFRIKTVTGANDFASHQEVLRRRFRTVAGRGGGGRGGPALGDAGPRHRRRGQGPGQRRQGGPRRAGPARPAAGRAGQGARGAVPARPLRARRAARHVAGPVPRPAAARRGAPLRDHLPPRPACASQRALGVRRPARRRAEAQARAAQGLRLDQAGARRAGRADRGRARDRASPRSTDQGDPRSLTPGFGSEFFIVRCTASLPAARRVRSAPRSRVAMPEGMLPRCTSMRQTAARQRPAVEPCMTSRVRRDLTMFRVTSRLDA